MHLRPRLALLSVLWLLPWMSTALAQSPPLEKVTVALDWTPNTNHTGLYVAKANGAFAKAGIDVTFVQPAQQAATVLVAAGKAQFGVSFVNDVVFARAQKVPVQAIAAIIQRSTACFAWRETARIASPKDWEGKRYGGWGAPEEEQTIRAVMQKAGADFSKVKMVTTGVSDFVPTTERNADFMWIYMGWDGIRAKLLGVKLKTLCPQDVDPAFDQPSPLLIAGDALLAKKPELAREFLLAATQGYTLAISDPAKAAAILLKEVPELDPTLVRESARFLATEYAKGAPRWGEMSEARFRSAIAWLKARGLVKSPGSATSHFTNAHLPPAAVGRKK